MSTSNDGERPMHALGALLAALYRAPMCSGLRGELRQWTDPTALRQLLNRPQRRGTVSIAIGAADPAPYETKTKVWVDTEDRTRVDQGDSTTVERASEAIHYHPALGAVRYARQDRAGLRFPHWLWTPRRLLGTLDVLSVVDNERLGRASWRVNGEPAAEQALGPPIEFALQGERFEFDVDQHTGVVLALSGRLVDGTPVTEIEWTEFEPDADVPIDVFDAAIPRDVPLQSPSYLHHPDLAVRHPDLAARLARSSPERRAEQYVPTGDPPADEERARREITRAFTDISATQDTDLVNVQAGHGLGPIYQVAKDRWNVGNLDVHHVKFLNADEAVVFFSVVNADGHPLLRDTEGRAIAEQGRWKVARNTFASLMRIGGIDCPPP